MSSYNSAKRWFSGDFAVSIVVKDVLVTAFKLESVGGTHAKEIDGKEVTEAQGQVLAMKDAYAKAIRKITGADSTATPVKTGYVRTFPLQTVDGGTVHIAALVDDGAQHSVTGYPLDKLPKWAANVKSASNGAVTVKPEDF